MFLLTELYVFSVSLVINLFTEVTCLDVWKYVDTVIPYLGYLENCPQGPETAQPQLSPSSPVDTAGRHVGRSISGVCLLNKMKVIFKQNSLILVQYHEIKVSLEIQSKHYRNQKHDRHN